ncbi:MAG: MBL fold metallo-hydrolase [Calditrichaeota bacterium]|nr:MAG: MBL fold metallo-hydrolase [Calditrichota bacterium]MBL1204890.1 MBL fold metallo-hydrolase [Calditrichota bacterium]NOG44719.1 MBL fold metallo-hydrolase [Calditrichota bacterium]
MNIEVITIGPFQMNTFIVHKENSNECILIDPSDELEKIYAYLDQNKLTPKAIFNTHAHIDHVRFLSQVQEKYNLPFYLAKEDLPLLESLEKQGEMFGIDTASPPKVTHTLEGGQKYDVAGLSFSTLHAPGHSPGSICFLFEKDIIVGDVLFYDSIGRTDLYMGNYDQLIESIKMKLMPLPDETVVYPGHGPSTTIGREKQFNPFLK